MLSEERTPQGGRLRGGGLITAEWFTWPVRSLVRAGRRYLALCALLAHTNAWQLGRGEGALPPGAASKITTALFDRARAGARDY